MNDDDMTLTMPMLREEMAKFAAQKPPRMADITPLEMAVSKLGARMSADMVSAALHGGAVPGLARQLERLHEEEVAEARRVMLADLGSALGLPQDEATAQFERLLSSERDMEIWRGLAHDTETIARRSDRATPRARTDGPGPIIVTSSRGGTDRSAARPGQRETRRQRAKAKSRRGW